MSQAWVYILRCRDGSLYTGWTNDLARRLERHRDGSASRYTASRRPVELAYAAAMPGRRAAMREEARIKALDRAGKLALLSSGPAPYGAVKESAARSDTVAWIQQPERRTAARPRVIAAQSTPTS